MGDDEVERREELVLIVEPPVGPDLELAAVEEAKALGRGLGRRRPSVLLRGETSVEPGDDRALLLDPLRGGAGGGGEGGPPGGPPVGGAGAAARRAPPRSRPGPRAARARCREGRGTRRPAPRTRTSGAPRRPRPLRLGFPPPGGTP